MADRCLTNRSMNKKSRYIVAISILVMLVLWELVSLRVDSEQILPGPWTTLLATLQLFCEKGFLLTVCNTILRGFIGFAMALVLGLVLGVLAGVRSGFAAFMRPWIVVMRSIPVVAFILLALIWLRSGSVPVFIGFLTMFPLIFTNVVEGILNVDKKLVDMAQCYQVSQRRIVREVYIPAIAPFVFSGVSSAFGIGWRAIVIGEVLSQPEYGIGTQMHAAQTFLNIDVLIAWTLVAILISFLFERLIRLLEHLIIKWK